MTDARKWPADSRRDGPKRRAAGLRALSADLPAVTKRALGRRGFADAALLGEWAGVVGGDLARSCEPLRLSFPNRRERTEGTLVLRVEPAFALVLQHLEPQLLERVNGFFGYCAVARIKLHQGPVRDRRGDRETAVPEPPEPDGALRDRLAQIPDEDLRRALSDLGRRFQAPGDRRA